MSVRESWELKSYVDPSLINEEHLSYHQQLTVILKFIQPFTYHSYVIPIVHESFSTPILLIHEYLIMLLQKATLKRIFWAIGFCCIINAISLGNTH